MRPKYVVAEVSDPDLVIQALSKASCIDPVILLDKVDNIRHDHFDWIPSAALLEALDLWGEAFGKGIVEGWKEIGGRRRGSSRRGWGGVDDDGNDDEWDGSESEREGEQAGNILKKYVLSLAEVHWGAQMNRWTGKQDEFAELAALS